MSRLLSKEQIKTCEDMKEQEVYVPEWSGTVIIKPFTMEERTQVRENSKVYNEKTNEFEIDADQLDLVTFIYGVREPEFGMADLPWLKKDKNSGAIARVVRVIAQKSGMLPDSEGDALKNSKETQQ